MANKKQNYDISVYTAIIAKSTKKLPENPEIILFEIYKSDKKANLLQFFQNHRRLGLNRPNFPKAMLLAS